MVCLGPLLSSSQHIPAARHPLHCGHLQQLLLSPGLLQVRGASLTAWSTMGCRGMPPSPVHCRAAPTRLPCAPVSPIPLFPVRSRAEAVLAALRGREPGITHTHHRREARGDAHAGTDRRTEAGRAGGVPVAPGCR